MGEAWGATPAIAKKYSNPDGSEFSMVFQFEHMVLDQEEGKEKWDLAPLPFVRLKKCLEKWQRELYGKGWNSLFWDNHDLPRIVSRWGDDGAYRVPSAKMLAAVLHGMQGTPYIYQGEELGMTNVRFDRIEDYRDIETLNMYRGRLEAGAEKEDIMNAVYAKSRDNARTPMQWNAQDNAGFTTGIPWLGVNPNYKEINAEKESKDPDFVYQFYRRLIRLRKTYPVFTDGKFELLLPEDEQIFAYTRTDRETELLVCANFMKEPAKCSLPAQWQDAEILIHNYKGAVADELRPVPKRLCCSESGRENNRKGQKRRQRTMNGKKPEAAETANIVKDSVVLGDVTVGEDSCVLFYAVLRGDVEKITVGKCSNIQDNCTVHADAGYPAAIGDYVTVGHNAVLHGCTVGQGSLIGMGSVILNVGPDRKRMSDRCRQSGSGKPGDSWTAVWLQAVRRK